MTSANVPVVVEVSGTAYDMGFQHGQQCRELIKQAIGANLADVILSGEKKAGVVVTREKIIQLTQRSVAFCEEEAPELLEEIRGIADGAELPFQDVFALNCFLDLHDLTYPKLASEMLFGCTTFAATDTATTDSQTWIGQTYDITTQFKPSVIFLKGKPESGPEFVVLTMAGCVAWSGLNSAGIGLVINRLTPDDGQPGVPYPLVVRRALAQKTIGLSVNSILTTTRMSGIHYLLADSEGNVLGVETSATDYEIIYSDNGIITHTNHYATTHMQQHAKYHRPFAAESIVRLNTSRRFLNRHHGHIGCDELVNLTKNHVNFPYSICRHPNEEVDPQRRSSTTAAIIMNPREQKVWGTAGNPCSVPYQEI